jgi:putative addiction module component (TIGR02574 family)
MSQRGSKLLQDVISLSLADRQALIEEVLASIDDDTLKAELKRRRDEYLADKSCSVPWRTILEDDKASSL